MHFYIGIVGHLDKKISFFEIIYIGDYMINDRIKIIREMLNLTQREIAEELHISKSTYARWETGEKIIPLSHLIDLCNLSKRSLDYILCLNNDRTITNSFLKINSISIGKKLKNLRIKNNESQEEIAAFLQCTQSVVSEYENGITLIQTSFLLQLCEKYNISANSIIL